MPDQNSIVAFIESLKIESPLFAAGDINEAIASEVTDILEAATVDENKSCFLQACFEVITFTDFHDGDTISDVISQNAWDELRYMAIRFLVVGHSALTEYCETVTENPDVLPLVFADLVPDFAHNAWYSAQGHGCGFCDGDFDIDGDSAIATRLDEAAKAAFCSEGPYKGDSGKMYFYEVPMHKPAIA